MAPSVELENMREIMNQQMAFDYLELGTHVVFLFIIILLWIAVRRVAKTARRRGQRRSSTANPSVIFEVNVNVDEEKKGAKQIMTRKVAAVKRSKLMGDSTVINNLKAGL